MIKVPPDLGSNKSMNTRRIAVINESSQLSAGDVARAAAAVQQQVTTDFSPVWGISATVAAFPTLKDMPDGFWPVVIRDVLPIANLGAHLSEAGDKPFALVAFSGSRWTITLSHEILEMLADELGTELIEGPSPKDQDETVQFLLEVCDPCQSNECAYRMNGDQWVSDFVIRDFYTGSGSGSFTFRGSIKSPRSVATGGYITWKDSSNGTWCQLYDDGQGPRFRNPAPDELRPDLHLRGEIDRDSALARSKRRGAQKTESVRALQRFQRQAKHAARVRSVKAAWWKNQIGRVLVPKQSEF